MLCASLTNLITACAVLCSAVTAVARIALVKPDKARNVENMILAAAQRGALQNKVRRSAEGALQDPVTLQAAVHLSLGMWGTGQAAGDAAMHGLGLSSLWFGVRPSAYLKYLASRRHFVPWMLSACHHGFSSLFWCQALSPLM
jgi:hypothetical protein